MERATILAALVSLAALLAAGDACDQVPSMSWNDACLKSCNFSPAWTTLCENTLSSASSPATADVTVFALAAVAKAKQMYESTVGTVMNPMLGAGNMPADLKAAVDNCKVKYGEAHGLMASIANQMFFCDFLQARQEYLDAQVAVESCHEGLSAFQSLPLYAAVSADYDMTMVTYELGALIVGNYEKNNMTGEAMTFVLATMISLATLFVAGDACNNVPTMTWTEACHKACDKQPWYKQCPETLKSAPDTAELTVYALVAGRIAKLKYEDTMATIDQLLGDGTIPAGEKAAVENCKVKYGVARGQMASVVDQLFACDFSRARQEYIDAQVAVQSCQNGLWSFKGLPLYAMVSADYDLTMVASELGELIVGK
ncbi:hypothetical protein EJB05_09851, partial [Eragrostis curvula]